MKIINDRIMDAAKESFIMKREAIKAGFEALAKTGSTAYQFKKTYKATDGVKTILIWFDLVNWCATEQSEGSPLEVNIGKSFDLERCIEQASNRIFHNSAALSQIRLAA